MNVSCYRLMAQVTSLCMVIRRDNRNVEDLPGVTITSVLGGYQCLHSLFP
jgi:hypothetical protein